MTCLSLSPLASHTHLTCTLSSLSSQRLSSDWPPYANLLPSAIIPLVQDLADAVLPLLASGLRATSAAAATSSAAATSPATPSAGVSGRSSHFELMACDLMVSVLTPCF